MERRDFMKKRMLSVLLCLCLTLSLLPLGVLAASTHTVKVVLFVDYSAAYEELAQLNELRRAAGETELVMDVYLMDMAVRRAAETTLFFSHTRPNGEQYSTARPSSLENVGIGENILHGGFLVSASKATEQWYNSEAHRTNMLYSSYRSVGIACVRTMSGDTYWVQNFASMAGTPESTPTSGTQTLRFPVELAETYRDLKLTRTSLSLAPGEVRWCMSATAIPPWSRM